MKNEIYKFGEELKSRFVYFPFCKNSIFNSQNKFNKRVDNLVKENNISGLLALSLETEFFTDVSNLVLQKLIDEKYIEKK